MTPQDAALPDNGFIPSMRTVDGDPAFSLAVSESFLMHRMEFLDAVAMNRIEPARVARLLGRTTFSVRRNEP